MPSRVTGTLGVALVDSDNVPAFTVAVAVTFEEAAAVAAAMSESAVTAVARMLIFRVLDGIARESDEGWFVLSVSLSCGRGSLSSLERVVTLRP